LYFRDGIYVPDELSKFFLARIGIHFDTIDNVRSRLSLCFKIAIYFHFDVVHSDALPGALTIDVIAKAGSQREKKKLAARDTRSAGRFGRDREVLLALANLKTHLMLLGTVL
jgi:hypothetical protein